MTSKQFLDEVKARDELLAMGYTLEKCKHCKGKGSSDTTSGEMPWPCAYCDGKGWNWKGPIAK